MKKETVISRIKYELNWKLDVKISKLKADLEAIEALGATHVRFDPYTSWEHSRLLVTPILERPETDEEFAVRKRILDEGEDENSSDLEKELMKANMIMLETIELLSR